MRYWIPNSRESWIACDNRQRPLISLLENMLAQRRGPGPLGENRPGSGEAGERPHSPALHAKAALSVCAAGAGGKTSLIWALQKECVLQNRQVLVTTTTHMMLTGAMLEQEIAAGIPVIPEIREDGWIKCSAPDRKSLDALRLTRDVLLIEADGSRRLPL